ncbi:TPA: tail fiber assembly protein [Enterobacter cloacae]|nr:tail fiber assembly protein [Enterobacter cloacae]
MGSMIRIFMFKILMLQVLPTLLVVVKSKCISKREVINMGYVYCHATGAFYNDALEADYRSAGSWPDNYVTVLDDDYESLMAGQAVGKMIVSDNNGYPVLTEPPEPTHEEQINQASSQKLFLMKAANEIITPLEDAVELGIATDEEAATLLLWKRYRVLLNRLDLSNAPDIEWPEKPQ